jgi:6-pyruvoyltetrahydropterin/6-carboxytetrahydropterin synthase
MYELGINRDFIARHYLIGGDWGAETSIHSHHYRLEVRVSGDRLDRHGYLIDIVELERAVDGALAGVAERVLNELPAFAGLNPSLEHFARILWSVLTQAIALEKRQLAVRLWENDRNWAQYSGIA